MAGLQGESDAELIVGSVEDVDLFGVLYERHVQAVLRFFVLRTGCAQTAADLTAETFAVAFDSRRRFKDVGAPGRAWLFKIAQRQLGRFVRTEQVGRRAQNRLGMRRLVLDDADIERVEQLVDVAAYSESIVEAMSTLPATQAEAVGLRVGLGLPYAEVSVRLGCSEGAARVRVTRGLSALATAFEEST